MKIAKYFWDLNTHALKETEKILKDPRHPKFSIRVITLLSRCDNPKELFTLFSKKSFIEFWPKVRAHWLKAARESEFREWWQTIYEELLRQDNRKAAGPKDISCSQFSKIGQEVKRARIQMGLSQRDLAFRVHIKQPDISKIEEGKKNITLKTLFALSRALNIKNIDLG